MAIDPCSIRAEVLEEDPCGQLDDLALDLADGSEPLVAAHVTLPDHVVASLAAPKPETVRAERDAREGSAVRIQLAPHLEATNKSLESRHFLASEDTVGPTPRFNK